MTTKLEKALKREITIKGEPFFVTITPEGFKLVDKGRRKGLEATWEALTSGEAALAVALRASLSPRVDLTPSKKSSTSPAHGERGLIVPPKARTMIPVLDETAPLAPKAAGALEIWVKIKTAAEAGRRSVRSMTRLG